VTTISKRDALDLVAQIRSANVSGHAIAARINGGSSEAMAGFIGALESVLRHWIAKHAGQEAAAALVAAMNHTPTPEELTAYNTKLASYGLKAAGSRA